MTHFLEKRDFWGNRLSLWIVVLLAFVTPICWWSVRQLRVESDLEKWLPSNDPELQSLQWVHGQFPSEEKIILTWDGSSLSDSRAEKLVEQLAGKPDSLGTRRGGLPYVASVIDPVHILKVMQENGIEPQEAAKRLQGTFLGAGTLRLQLTEIGRSAFKKTRRELQSAFRSRFKEDLVIQDPTLDLTPLVSIPVPGDSQETPIEPTAPAILSAEGELVELSTLDHDLQVSWKSMRVGDERTIEIANWFKSYIPEKGDRQSLVEGCFFAIGSPIAICVGISEAGVADKAETVAAIREACKLAGIPEESLHLAGGMILASDLNKEVTRVAWDRSVPLLQIHRRSVLLSSLLISVLLAALLLRSIRLTFLMGLVSVVTAFAAMALVPITGGSMNLMLIVLPNVLVVLTLSGAVHFAAYWRYTAGSDETKSIVDAFRKARNPCLLAGLTAAVAMLSLVTSRITPISEFGLYAASGVILSLIILSYGLPSLMQFLPIPLPQEQDLERAAWKSLGQFLTFRSGWQSLVVLTIGVGLSLGLTRFRTDTNIVRFFPEQSKIARDYSFFEWNLGGVLPVENIVRFDEQSQKETNFLDRMELIRQIQMKMRKHIDVSGATSLADFHPVSEQPPDDASFLFKTKHNKKATVIQQRIRDGEIEFARSCYSISDMSRDRQDSSDQPSNQPGDELWRITAQVNLMNDHDFSKVLSDFHEITQDVLKLQPGSRHLIAGTVPVFVRTQQAVVQSLVSSSAMALTLVFFIFFLHLRNFGAAIVAMIPTIAPMTIVLGASSWLQQRFDVISIMTAPIALGIASSGTLHYLSWVQIAMKQGRSRREAIVEGIVHGGPPVWQTSAIIALSLVMFIPVELRGISRFGMLVAAMTAVSLITNLVLLPQLLGGPFGWLFESTSVSKSKVVTLSEPKECPQESLETPNSDDGKGPPPPHIKPIDPTRKKRRPTA